MPISELYRPHRGRAALLPQRPPIRAHTRRPLLLGGPAQSRGAAASRGALAIFFRTLSARKSCLTPSPRAPPSFSLPLRSLAQASDENVVRVTVLCVVLCVYPHVVNSLPLLLACYRAVRPFIRPSYSPVSPLDVIHAPTRTTPELPWLPPVSPRPRACGAV
ncbi:hypothetical protein C8Q78DRAFT_736260 [Trametes maxima]|nr:hypothetical protein C8Q78DRAFT_736260 [Trametes maxima]